MERSQPEPTDIGDAMLRDLIGRTRADFDRHAVARAAFMNLFLGDMRVNALFAVWRSRLRLPSSASVSEAEAVAMLLANADTVEGGRRRIADEAIHLTK